jgi:hypothetical protein
MDMDNKQKESYSPPMLVKHGILRDIAVQFDELIQVDRLSVGILAQNRCVTAALETSRDLGGDSV